MKNWLIHSIIVAVLTAMAFAGAVAVYGLQGSVPGGMNISGWEIGGMKANSVHQALHEKLHMLQQKKVVMKAHVPQKGTLEREISLGELGLRTNEEAIEGRLAALAEGNVWVRAVKRWQERNSTMPLKLGFDPAAFNASVRRLWPELYETQPVPAIRTITPDDQVKYIPEIPALRLEAEALLRSAVAALYADEPSRPIPLPGPGDAGSFPALRALRPDGMLLSSRPVSLDVPLYELKPDVTVESLKREGVERVIARFSTSFARSAAGRKHNVSSAAAVVHDMLLKPGEVFDYAKVIQETEERFGFREAPVILNGKLAPGIGGGICQVSTTLYNAVLRAGLEIVERRNHSVPINYAPLGQDATFASGYINFRFKNTTGHHLLIRTSSENGVLTVKLFGTMDKNVSYDIRSTTVKTIPPSAKYVRNPSLPKGTVTLLQQGKTGYVVETYRYKKAGGKVVDKELISRDTYKAQPALYGSNSGETPPAKSGKSGGPQMIEDGVRAPVFR